MGRINRNEDIDSDEDMEDTTESDQCTSDDSKENEDDDDTVIEPVPDNEVETEVNATEASGVFPNVDHELPSITSEEDNTVNDGEEDENVGKHNVNDGTRRSNRPHALVKEYEPTFHGNRYENNTST